MAKLKKETISLRTAVLCGLVALFVCCLRRTAPGARDSFDNPAADLRDCRERESQKAIHVAVQAAKNR